MKLNKNNALLTWIYLLVRHIYFTDGGWFNGKLREKLNLPTLVPTQPTPPPIPTNVDDVVRQQLGGTVRTSKYNNQYYNALSGGPVKDGDDVECNFQGFCCWDNVAFPTDQFDWTWASGDPDPQKLSDNFGVTRPPNGRFLMATRMRSSATDEAMFISCTITCTTRPIQVKFKHWTTQGVQLQVCSSETFFNENNKIQLINCKDVKKSESPGPSTITIPPGEFLDIIFVAGNFQNNFGGIAMIDDISVSITPCADKPQGSATNVVNPKGTTKNH